MSRNLPVLLSSPSIINFPATVSTEIEFLSQARKLLDAGFPDHSLLDIWNAAVHNLRRRVEAYGLELFLSAIKDDSGRKKYDKDGETINERWSGVDDMTPFFNAFTASFLGCPSSLQPAFFLGGMVGLQPFRLSSLLHSFVSLAHRVNLD